MANQCAVRLAVQFQSILDTFTHDTVFSFVAARELSESALGLSTILPTSSATGSSKASSSSSLRQQRLDEIAEDSEEAPAATHTETLSMSPRRFSEKESDEVDGLPSSAARAKALLAKRKQERAFEMAEPSPRSSEPEAGTAHAMSARGPEPESAAPTAGRIVADNDLPTPPREELLASLVSLSKSNSVALRPSLDFSLPQVESDSDDDFRRPMPKEYPQIRYSHHLSAAESNSISKWSDDVLASTSRAKQRRAPRPYPDGYVRPRTSGNSDEAGPSRRANLPTTVRISKRSSDQPSTPASQQSARSVPTRFIPSSDTPPSIPSTILPSVHTPRPSQGRPVPSQISSFSNETVGVTPEKMRLMKALQMRKRNQLLAQRSNSATSISPNPLASTDSSRSTTSDLSAANLVPLFSESVKRDSESQDPELANIHESQTTSPTSIMTISDEPSTKPSSFSDYNSKDGSRTSTSSGTGSSTTPKAEAQKGQPPENASPAAVENADFDERPKSPPQGETVKVSEDESKAGQYQAYHCATADSLAGIEEEDRGRAESIVESENHPDTAASPYKRSKKQNQLEGDITRPLSTADLPDDSDDESFMEELQNATVHEAKPVSVNRTPATPVLSKTSTRANTFDMPPEPSSATSDQSLSMAQPNNARRSPSIDSQVSTPNRQRAASRAGSTRSLSTALPQWPPHPTEPVPALPKQRPIIGATISKRVKTFEGLSQREASPPVLTPKDQALRSSSLSKMLKRTSFLAHSQGEKPPETPMLRASPSPLRAEFESTERDFLSRPWVQRPGSSTEVYSPTHKGETVSVTARIVRDPVKPKSAHGTSDTTRSMHISPLIVEHENFMSSDVRPHLPREMTAQSMDSIATSTTPSERRRFSFSSHKSGGQTLSPNEAKSHRMSLASHKKTPKAPSDSSSVVDEKRQSRTSRMLKRLSGMGKSRSQRESIMSSPTREHPQSQPNILEETVEGTTGPTTRPDLELDPSLTRHVVDIGEVNVQFADTLLWKRRFLRVDDQGYLIFAPPTNDFSTRGRSPKIHLEELYKPALPDREREEMAWSILLDLKNGGTVQCACESRSAQQLVLKSEFKPKVLFNENLTKASASRCA